MENDGIKIICNEFLSSNTIMVSSDIYKMLKEKYTVEELDRHFLIELGIKVPPL